MSNENENTNTVPRVAHLCRRPWCCDFRKTLVPSDHRTNFQCTVQAKCLDDVKHLLTITKYQAHNVPTLHLIVSLSKTIKNLQLAAFRDANYANAMYAYMFSMIWCLVLHARCCK